jgi:hypothetical protein
MSALQDITPALKRLAQSYHQNTTVGLKFIDVYLVFIMASGILQFLYMLAVGTFPYNAFLAGFISTVGSFVLAGEYFQFYYYPFFFVCLSYPHSSIDTRTINVILL